MDGYQTFIAPNTLTGLIINVGPEVLDPSIASNIQNVLSTNQTWVYVMEITVRYNTVSPYNVTDIQHAISPVHDPKLVFQADYPTSVWDNRYENILD